MDNTCGASIQRSPNIYCRSTVGRTTRYATLLRLVRARNNCTFSRVVSIRMNILLSSRGGNVAVIYTICTPNPLNRPSRAISGRKSFWSFNITWHSSMIIRSNRCCILCRFKNPMKSGPSADSGVTSTIFASSAGCRLSHSMHRIFNRWHRRCISLRNAINGTTTTVVPPATHAGNMNNTLLPPPVGITVIIGLCPCWIASIAGPWTPRNRTSSSPIIFCNSGCIGVSCNFHRRSWRLRSASISHGDGWLAPRGSTHSLSPHTKPKNRCQSVLDNRNNCRRCAVVPGCSVISRPYTMPATCDECAACKSATWPVHSSAPMPPSSSASSWSSGVRSSVCTLFGNWLECRIYRRLMPMAISRYAVKLIAPSNPRLVSLFKSSRNRSELHTRCVSGSGGHIYAARWCLAGQFGEPLNRKPWTTTLTGHSALYHVGGPGTAPFARQTATPTTNTTPLAPQCPVVNTGEWFSHRSMRKTPYGTT
ncbi:unnamed protein product [Penicillium nalgiovense]|nr:unnamed protein product [Penicillium nalgiovense]